MVLQHVQHAAALGEEAAAGIAGKQAHAVLVAAVQPVGGTQPVAAVAVVHDRGGAHVGTGRPRRRAHAVVAADPEQAALGAGPHGAVAVAGQAEHALVAQHVRGDAGERFAIPARYAAAGADPDPPLRIGQHAVDGVAGQAVRIGGVGAEPHQAAVFVAAADAMRVGADPQCLAGIGERPELPFAQDADVGELFEVFAVRAQHAQAAAIAADPDPVQRIDEQRFDFIAGQRAGVIRFIAPDSQTDPVDPCQAIVGGRPDVALAVLGKRQHHARGHAFGGTEAAHARCFCRCPCGPQRRWHGACGQYQQHDACPPTARAQRHRVLPVGGDCHTADGAARLGAPRSVAAMELPGITGQRV